VSIPSYQPTRRRLLVGAVALALAAPLAACSSVADKVEQAADSALPSTAGRARLAEHPLSEDLAALAEKVGTDDLRVFDVTITEATFTASVQDPAKPENVDAYSLDGDGSWGAPAPVELIGSGDLEANLFSVADVAWDEVDALADQALVDLALEGAEISTILVKMALSGEVEISVHVDGTRVDGQLRARADGTVIEATES
jgi:hypothetical protein